MENENRLRDMTDYYTLWAHQIKTPIAALGLLLQETGESGPLEVELLKIEQYVEMVLSYLRLDSGWTATPQTTSFGTASWTKSSVRRCGSLPR